MLKKEGERDRYLRERGDSAREVAGLLAEEEWDENKGGVGGLHDIERWFRGGHRSFPSTAKV